MPIRFRPPRDIPDLGLTRGQQERFNAWLRTAFTEIAEDMATLGQTDAPTIVAQETIDVAAGSLRRVTPPEGGMAVRIPAPTPANAGQTVRLMIEAPVGDLTVVAVPGIGDDGKVFQPTINGEPRATFSTSGLVTLTSNGSSDWKSASEFAAESPTSIAISSGGAALDAQYLLRTANAQLPNARVADDSTEIDIGYSSPGLISWFLKTASVAFSKLANLAGLSVLGRAANSSGVMAAITATAANQKLVSNEDASALEWVRDLPTSFFDVLAAGTYEYELPAGFRDRDTMTFQLTGSVTLNALFLDGGVPPPDGFEVKLALIDQSGGSAPGHSFSIADNATGLAGQFRTPGQVQGTVPGPDYVMRSEEECCFLSYQNNNWRIIAGTAAQAIDGDITVLAGNGATRTAAITAGVIVNADVNASAAIAQTKLGATTGFSVKASGSAATTSAEPIITYSASANMSAERVLTTSTSNTIDISVAGQAQVLSVAKTGAISQAANANTTLFAGIRDNGSAETDRTNLNFVSTTFITAAVTDDAGNDELEVGYSWTGVAVERNNVAVATGVTAWDYQVTAPITLSVTVVGGEVRVLYALDLTATIAWTGGHSWNTAGDFTVTAAIVGLNSNSTLGLDSVGDMTLQSDGDLILTGDEVRVRSNGTGGFLTFDAATASTPGLTAGEGMFWVSDPGAAPTLPMFTADDNVDYPIFRGLASTTTDVTSTSTTAATVDYTMPASSNVVGTTYRLEAFVTYVKTAVNTTDPRFVIQVAGTNVAFIQIDQLSTAGTHYFRVHGTFTVRTLGGIGVATYAVGLQVTGESNATQVLESIVNTPAAATLDTTASQNLSIGVAIAATVAGDSITINTATIERVYR